MRLLILLSVLLFSLVPLRVARAQAADRDGLTQEDHECIAALREAGGEQLRQLEQANAAFAQSNWSEAARLYGLLPADSEEMSRLPLRRRCQALTELGQRELALASCGQLMNLVIPNAADLQAYVGALMVGSGRPSDADLATALQMARRAEGIDPDSVWAHASRCAIAQRVNDRSALAQCSARLKELAPNHWLTQRFAQTAERPLARYAKLAVFGALLLALLLTAAHRLLSRRRSMRGALALTVLIALWSNLASAQAIGITEAPRTEPNSSGPPTEEEHAADSESEAFKEEAKALQELTDKITAAEQLITEKQDWPAAVNAYIDVVTMAPYCGKCWRRLCEGFSYVVNPTEGEHACRQAIASPDNNAWDRAMLVHHLLTGKSQANPEVRAEAKRMADEAVKIAPGERWGYDARCELALRDNDLPSLKACASKLDELAHDDRKTLSLLFGAAIAEKRLSDAEALIERGKKDGLDAGTVKIMEDTLTSKGTLLMRLRRSAPSAMLAMLLTAALLFGARFVLAARARKVAVGLPKKPA